jgi:hypothetical protein
VETGETGETLFYIASGIKLLGCEQKCAISLFSKNCYFSEQFPKNGNGKGNRNSDLEVNGVEWAERNFFHGLVSDRSLILAAGGGFAGGG